MPKDYSRLMFGGAILFFGIMASITLGLVWEYNMFCAKVREISEIRQSYKTQETPEMVQKKKDDYSFVVVNRNPEYLRKEALRYAEQKKIPVEHLYTKKRILRKSPRVCNRKRVNKHIHIHRASKRVREGQQTIQRLFPNLQWILPIDPAQFWISSQFGKRKNPNGTWGFHWGLDMAANKGTAVRSVSPGIVIQAWYDRKGYGKTIVIRHDRHFKTRYAHLSEMHVNVGKQVQAGEIIGAVGNTGHVRKRNGRDGTHLHFEVYLHGKRMNPLYFLKT